MPWNYRIIQYDDGSYGLHEVYYDKQTGKHIGRTDKPARFACHEDETKEGIIKSLELALSDAKKRPVLVDPWPKGRRKYVKKT